MTCANWELSQSTYAECCERLRPSAALLEALSEDALFKSPPAKPTKLLRVLVVDDDRDAANSLSILVKIWGHDVRVAYNGANALEIATTFQPDAFLLDIAMPGMDGNRLAKLLRQQTCFQNTLLIAISGYADEAHRLNSMAAGFDHYLVKPMEFAALEQLLNCEEGRRAAVPKAVLLLRPLMSHTKRNTSPCESVSIA